MIPMIPTSGHAHMRRHAHPVKPASVIPAELLRSAPREVVLNGSGRLAAGVAIFFLIAAFATLLGLGQQAIRDSDFRDVMAREGVPSPAEVLTVRRTRGDNPSQVIRYRFVADGVPYENTASLRLRRQPLLHPGETIRIRYQRAAPENNWVAGFEPRGVPLWVVPLIALALLTIPLGIRHSIHKQRSLLREGRPALATVVRTRSMGQGKPVPTDFEFRDLSGSHHSGRCAAPAPLPVGTTIAILYDRESPSKSMVYPFSLVRVDVPSA